MTTDNDSARSGAGSAMPSLNLWGEESDMFEQPGLLDMAMPDPAPARVTTPAAGGASVSAPVAAEAAPARSRAQSQTLYRKWRSQTFDELVGQDAITRTLRNAITAGRVGHAYLFCGPRGTGKTSTGRLLAKAVNCLEADPHNRPCDRCEACRSIAEARAMDLIEIDAASNRGIDEVRELRDKINFQPSYLRKKVYIIDEVHMMTEAAFNALLKTLEEPPPHALFILATTDPQDIPATVVSRCQRFDFQRIGLEQVVARLGFVCEQEGIEFEGAALDLVARQATGSLRDALSLLDQLIVYSGGNITVETVRLMLGVMNTEAVADFVDALIAVDMGRGLELINRLVQSGTDLKRFNRELVEHLRLMMLLRVNPNGRERLDLPQEAQERVRKQAGELDLNAIVTFLKIFSGVDYNLKVSPYGQLPLEIALMESLLRPVATSPVAASGSGRAAAEPAQAPRPAPVAARPAPVESSARAKTAEVVAQAKPDPAEQATPPVPAEPTPVPAPVDSPVEPVTLDLPGLELAWKRTRDNIKAQSKMTGALLDYTRPIGIHGNRILLAFAYEFHRNRINQDSTRRSVEDHFSKVVGQRVLIECVEDAETSKAPSTPASGATRPREKEDDRAKRAADFFNARILD